MCSGGRVLQTGRARPALSTLFGPELKVTDTELFGKLDGDVSRLGARAVPLRGEGERPRRPRQQRNGVNGTPPLPLAPAPAPAALVKPLNAAATALALPVPGSTRATPTPVSSRA